MLQTFVVDGHRQFPFCLFVAQVEYSRHSLPSTELQTPLAQVGSQGAQSADVLVETLIQR